MPLMHTGELKDARKYKHLSQYGGTGFEWWQFVLGAATTIVVAGAVVLVSFVLPGLLIIGLAVAIAAGGMATIAPNLIDTHHKDSRHHLLDEFKRLRERKRTLIVDDRKVLFPQPTSLDCVVEINHYDTDIEEALNDG